MMAPIRRARTGVCRVAFCAAAVGAAFVVMSGPAAADSVRPVPTFACAAANGDGRFTYFFGYTLDGNASIDVPIGGNNRFSGSSENLGQPTTFQSGSHANAFSITTANTDLEWHLRSTSLHAASSQLCTNVPVVSEAPAALVLPLAGAGPFVVWFAAMRRRARRVGLVVA